MPIYNCHTHIFTVNHTPDDFLPLKLTSLMKIDGVRTPLSFLLTNANPFSSRDLFSRYANFVKTTYKKSQKDIFEQLRSYYPLDTKFVILPMDMAFMGCGKVGEDIHRQHDDLLELKNIYPDQALPFAAIDPRREGVLEMLEDLVDNKGFRGVKLYPPLGYAPDHETLLKVYAFAESRNIPIMAHCSRGGVKNRQMNENTLISYTSPDSYKKILKDFPNLRVCLSHFGGEQDWSAYLDNPWDEKSDDESKSWLSKILDMLRSGEYPNLYTDIAYTIFHFEDNSKILKVLLSDERVREKVLFGSDYYMVEQEKLSERRLVMTLRAAIGEELFWQISQTNPERYLG